MRVSRMNTSSPRSRNASVRCEPKKPAPPVIRTFMIPSPRSPRRGSLRWRPTPVPVAPAGLRPRRAPAATRLRRRRPTPPRLRPAIPLPGAVPAPAGRSAPTIRRSAAPGAGFPGRPSPPPAPHPQRPSAAPAPPRRVFGQPYLSRAQCLRRRAGARPPYEDPPPPVPGERSRIGVRDRAHQVVDHPCRTPPVDLAVGRPAPAVVARARLFLDDPRRAPGGEQRVGLAHQQPSLLGRFAMKRQRRVVVVDRDPSLRHDVTTIRLLGHVVERDPGLG